MALDLTVKEVELIPVDVPFRAVPAANMVREIPDWTLFELCKVTLACGVVGVGETMRFYTWGVSASEDCQRAKGRNAAELMWDDSLGAGLQMALFDAVGKANDVPAHRLLGHACRDRAPVSWWAIDMSAEDWILECKLARKLGYTNFKTKARPWWDVIDQTEQLCATLPPWFEVDLDFNGLLNDVSRAVHLCCRLQENLHVRIFETPLPQGDIAGNKHLRSRIRVPIAMHFDRPIFESLIRQDACDGFVIGGGASAIMRQGASAARFNKPFFLQLVGTSITAAWSLQFGAVLTHATWPAVNCHQLYTEAMLADPIAVADGSARVPDGPGLGVEVDFDAVERLRTDPFGDRPYPAPGLLLGIRWPSGGVSYYTHTRQHWTDFQDGRLPNFVPGVRLERIDDDGSAEWRELQARASQSPVHCDSPAF